jgi:hypothetical protein
LPTWWPRATGWWHVFVARLVRNVCVVRVSVAATETCVMSADAFRHVPAHVLGVCAEAKRRVVSATAEDWIAQLAHTVGGDVATIVHGGSSHPYESVFVDDVLADARDRERDAHFMHRMTTMSPIVILHTRWAEPGWRATQRELATHESTESARLVVVEAWYGPTDVRDTLRRHIRNDSLYVGTQDRVDLLLAVDGSDPMPGRPKSLFVRYTWCGVVRSCLRAESHLHLLTPLAIGASYEYDAETLHRSRDLPPQTLSTHVLESAETPPSPPSPPSTPTIPASFADVARTHGSDVDTWGPVNVAPAGERKVTATTTTTTSLCDDGRGVFVILTACLLKNDHEELRKQQYMYGIRSVLARCTAEPRCRICIVENNSLRYAGAVDARHHKTFLNDFGIPVLYTRNNALPTHNIGIKELADVWQCLAHFGASDSDLVVKMTARYSLHPTSCPFFECVFPPPSLSTTVTSSSSTSRVDYDSIARYGGYLATDLPCTTKGGAAITGLIALACRYVKAIEMPSHRVEVERNWAKASLSVPDHKSCILLRLGIYMAPGGNSYHVA